jgi:hypothetical protein
MNAVILSRAKDLCIFAGGVRPYALLRTTGADLCHPFFATWH